MDNHFKIVISEISEVESLLGLLSILPFEGFEPDESSLAAYIKADQWTSEVRQQVEEWVVGYKGVLQWDEIPFQNWNQTWEKEYPAVEIDNICRIYAPFHLESTGQFENQIQILPQMAFGTGHHETTEMMIRLMSQNKSHMEGKDCLDFGAGSGVLAIYAALNGAQSVVAVEIDTYAAQNMMDNFQINHFPNIEGYCGDVTQLPKGKKYNFILANVTRNVITDHLSFFKDSLLTNGKLIISGIMLKDEEYMIDAASKHNWSMTNIMRKGKWCAIELIQK